MCWMHQYISSQLEFRWNKDWEHIIRCGFLHPTKDDAFRNSALHTLAWNNENQKDSGDVGSTYGESRETKGKRDIQVCLLVNKQAAYW